MKVNFLIVGIIIIIIGIAGYKYTLTNIPDCSPFLDQLTQFFNSTYSFRCELVYVIEVAFLVFGAIGITTLIIGSQQKTNK